MLSLIRDCLRAHALQNMGAGQVKCPHRECEENLQEREVRDLLPPDKFQQFHALSVAGAEAAAGAAAFHCKEPDCRGWCLLADENNPGNALAGDINVFDCPICAKVSLKCDSNALK